MAYQKTRQTSQDNRRIEEDWSNVHEQLKTVQTKNTAAKKSGLIQRKAMGGNPNCINDYLILISEPYPRLIPSIAKPGGYIEVEDKYAFPTANYSYSQGDDDILSVTIQIASSVKGKYSTKTAGTISVRLENGPSTFDYEDYTEVMRQLGTFEIPEKDLQVLLETLGKIPETSSYFHSIPVEGFKKEVAASRANYLRTEKRKLSGGTPGTCGTNEGKSYVVYENEVRLGGSPAWRNNNPGNIRKSSVMYEYGAIAYNPQNFAIYPDYATGKKAIKSLLKEKNGPLTITKLMSKYAPPEDNNDPVAYAKHITELTGIESSRTVNSLNDTELNALCDAIEKIEGTIKGTLYKCGDKDLPAWVQNLLQCS